MPQSGIQRRSEPLERTGQAASVLADALELAGWDVERRPERGHFRPDLRARRRGVAYAVVVKAAPEGRPDRLVPLFAQAVLQAGRAAGRNTVPLAVVAAPRIAPRAAEQILQFGEDYAADAAVGVLDFEGLRLFRGPHLDALNAPLPHRPAVASPARREAGHLFSDLNQWMLKVLLAPELPKALLSAPRGQYRNASQLARAADVSVMSAFRLVQQLQAAGYLHESAPHLSLVRREDLFARWQASARRSVREVPLRFILPGNVTGQIHKMLRKGPACLGLFAAADALRLGLVEGVPPYVCVQRVRGTGLAAWKELRPCGAGEPPHLILREAQAPHSVFRGMVHPSGIAASDVLQVWVDVASHPARGREQADLIRKRVLQPIIGGTA